MVHVVEGFALEVESWPSSLIILQFIVDVFVQVATCALDDSILGDTDDVWGVISYGWSE